MPPRWGQRQYRFRCIEVQGFGAGPGACQRRRGTCLCRSADRSSAGPRKRGGI